MVVSLLIFESADVLKCTRVRRPIRQLRVQIAEMERVSPRRRYLRPIPPRLVLLHSASFRYPSRECKLPGCRVGLARHVPSKTLWSHGQGASPSALALGTLEWATASQGFCAVQVQPHRTGGVRACLALIG